MDAGQLQCLQLGWVPECSPAASMWCTWGSRVQGNIPYITLTCRMRENATCDPRQCGVWSTTEMLAVRGSRWTRPCQWRPRIRFGDSCCVNCAWDWWSVVAWECVPHTNTSSTKLWVPCFTCRIWVGLSHWKRHGQRRVQMKTYEKASKPNRSSILATKIHQGNWQFVQPASHELQRMGRVAVSWSRISVTLIFGA